MMLQAVIAAPIGACLGSYATTAALRSARGEQSTLGRSRCDHCGVSLNMLQTTPFLAYALQGGGCARCGGRIDPAHVWGESAGGLICASSFLLLPVVQATAVAGLGLVLLASAVVDAKSQRLPNRLTLAVAVTAIGLALIKSMDQLFIGLCSGAVAFLVLDGVRRAFLRLRGRPALGFGDVKLVGALGLWLGLGTPWAIMTAAILGLVGLAIIRPKDGRIAFGPALAIAGWTFGLFKEAGLWPGLI